MCRKVFIIIVVMGIMIGANAIQAADWVGGGGDNNWDTGANWSGGAPPVLGDWGIIGGTFNPEIDASVNTANLGLLVRDQATIDMTGGGLATQDAINLGEFSGNPATANATFNMSGGNATLGSVLWVGFRTRGVLNMTNGTMETFSAIEINFDLNDNGDSSGEIHLDGGTLIARALGINNKAGHTNGFMDITNGELQLVSSSGFDFTNHVEGLRDLGYITAFGGNGILQISFDQANTTSVTAIPEPVTIALLSLGGMFVIRRKRA
jgi:hypothetical protein